MRVRYLSDDEETLLRAALDANEEKLRQKRDRGNLWRRQRGYELLPDLRTLPFADRLKPMVLVSLNTGVRRGEIFNLKWPDVDLEKRHITIEGRGAKTAQTRHIPLNAEAWSTLRDWSTQSEGAFVFPSDDGGRRLDNVNKSWRSLMQAARITGFRWHDLRHTFASKLVMAGVDLNTVRELLGHSDIKMTLRYAHLAPEHKAKAVELLTKPVASRRQSHGG